MFFDYAKQKLGMISTLENPMDVISTKELKSNIERDYEKLCSVTEKTINQRMRSFNNKLNKVSPLSIALYHASQFQDRRFIELLKLWLGLSDGKLKFENIDVNVISDAGVTPVNAAICQYKFMRFSGNSLDEQLLQNMYDFKQIALKLIEMSKTEYLKVESKRSFLCPLQEAIHSYVRIGERKNGEIFTP